jgi:hypothetical protein
MMQFSKMIMPTIQTTGSVQSWSEEHDGEPQHLPWPANSLNLNITEPLWSVLETRVRNSFPHPTSPKQLEEIFHEEWYKILLETVQNSIQRTAAVLKAKGHPTLH